MLQRLLLLPLLSPLLVTLLVAALNPAPAVSLRLLTWRSAPVPIGLWLALAAGGGAALSAGATALALRQGGLGRRRRQGHDRGHDQEIWEVDAAAPAWGRPTRQETAPAPDEAAAPARAPGEPAPTVSVPYRVLHRPQAAAEPPFGGRPPSPSPPATPAHRQQPEAASDWDDWHDEEW